MRAVLAQLSALLMSVGLIQLGHGAFGTFLGLRADLEGFPTTLIGVLGSAFYLGIILGTLRAPVLINRIGHIRAFAAFAAIACASVMIYPLFIDPYAWIVLRVVFGFNLAGLAIVGESWLNNRSTNETRGTMLSIYMMVCFLAIGVGQLALNIGDPSGTQLFLFTALCLVLAVVPVAVTRSTHPDPVASSHFGIRKLYEISPGAVIACMGSGLVTGAYFGMATIYARQIGLSVADISIFMGTLMVSGLMLQLPIGRLSDIIDRRWVIVGTCLGTGAAGAAMTMLSPSNWWLFLGVTGIFGGLAACIYPLALSHANDFIEPHDLVPASGGLVLCYGVGAICGPFSAAWTMDLVGPSGMFFFTTANCVAIVVFTLYRSTRRQLLPTVEKDPYVALPDALAMPVATDVDPRAMEQFSVEDVGPPTLEEVLENETPEESPAPS